MKAPRVRSLMVAVALVAFGIAGWRWAAWKLEVYGKVEYCRGWGVQHAAEAERHRREAAEPGISPEEARGRRMEARRHAIMARKYLAVADDPSLPYPGTPYPRNPIITAEEVAGEPDRAAQP